jgi:prepilin signal peptidase PulO-like enzyme (type II secretory pathway)
MGFLWPDSGFFSTATLLPFPLAMLFNFFLIAFFYLLVYSIALGIRSPKVSRKFLSELGQARKGIAGIIGLFTVACIVLMAVVAYQFGVPLDRLLYILIFPPLLLSVLVFTRYGRFVEENLFKKQIPASKLRVGDVLISDRWRGLTEKEVSSLKKKGGQVWIKEGVRFAPVFVITVLVTLFFGNLLMIFI